MTQSFFACSCAQRPAHFEVYVGGRPVDMRYPFLCVDCFHKNVATIFAERKVEEVPQWLTDGPEPRIRMPKWGEGTEVIPRSHGIVATEGRVAEIRKHTDIKIGRAHV